MAEEGRGGCIKVSTACVMCIMPSYHLIRSTGQAISHIWTFSVNYSIIPCGQSARQSTSIWENRSFTIKSNVVVIHDHYLIWISSEIYSALDTPLSRYEIGFSINKAHAEICQNILILIQNNYFSLRRGGFLGAMFFIFRIFNRWQFLLGQPLQNIGRPAHSLLFRIYSH